MTTRPPAKDMSFFRVAMKGTALLVLLTVTLNSSCVGASLNDIQVVNDQINSLYSFNTEENTLRLTWNLLNPSGAVRGYRVTWNDGLSDKQAHVAETEMTLEYPSNLDCTDEFTVTVLPLDDASIPIGKYLQERIALQDVVTDVIVTPEENWISVSWSIKCPSEEVTEIVVVWEEVSHSHEVTCYFPGTATDTTAPTSCTPGKQVLQSCMSYRISIGTLDSSSDYISAARDMLSSTLEERSSSKLVEAIKRKETTPRWVNLLWNGPNPECHGVNYNVTYTEIKLENNKTVKGQARVEKWSKWSKLDRDKSIIANLHPSDNGRVMGHMENLQPYTKYEFCVASGSQGDNSVCMTASTTETKPEQPTHLVIVPERRSPSTIDVMWKEPSNMNGKFVNYIIRWYRDSEHSGSHNTTKLFYTIVDADSCVNYTIRVTAVNGAGEGEAVESQGVIEDETCPKSDCTPTPDGSPVSGDIDPHKDAQGKDEDTLVLSTNKIVGFVSVLVLHFLAACLCLIYLIRWMLKKISEAKMRQKRDCTPTPDGSSVLDNAILIGLIVGVLVFIVMIVTDMWSFISLMTLLFSYGIPETRPTNNSTNE